MIRIQKLKEPKVTSGWKVESGETIKIRGMEILNSNNFTVYVDFYQRKKIPRLAEKKGKQK